MAKKALGARDVIETLRGTLDPEVGINIVDMGLIYGISINPKNNNIELRLTMTSPMCPVINIMLADVQMRLESLPDVGKVDVKLVWDPPWTPDMMSEEHRLAMGVI
jgi:metal-sulfur cluster biosynthetic enzyme